MPASTSPVPAVASQGLDVALIGRTAVTLEETAALVESEGARALVVTADVGDEADVRRAARTILESSGAPRVVVHNAGVTRDKTLGRMTEDLWNLVIGINLDAEQRIDHELFERKVIRDNGNFIWE